MTTFFLWTILCVFSVATLALAMYGIHLYVLVFLFRRRVTRTRQEQQAAIKAYTANRADCDWPVITTQLPIYNEGPVAKRVIDAVVKFDYPKGRHEIQVLDDSDDRTVALVDRAVEEHLARGVDIKVIRRPERLGYKAGALAHGLTLARGEHIAIFDADFVPPPNFLRRAVPLLDSSADLACLQGRWDHLNRDESWLTEAQSLGIDGHFAIEQGARAWNGLMMNFNGTAGIWRKAAIDDPAVGGWSGDTLTEDLDLSYRVQLAGWRLGYCVDIACPAELPGTVAALKSQQRRWATGSIQVARKLLPRIWRAKLSLGEKVEATLHLTHYSVAVWMLLLALVARPMLLVFTDGKLFNQWFWVAWGVILISAFAPSMTYAYARYTLEGRWSGLRVIPSMIMLGCGLCLNNTIAVVRGIGLKGGEFVRTPKSGSEEGNTALSPYRLAQDKMWILEILLGLYSGASFVVYFTEYHRAFSFFLALYAIGFLMIGWRSRPQATATRNDTASDDLCPPLLNTEVVPAESVSGA